MFLNISTGGDLRRIVVRLCACLFFFAHSLSRSLAPVRLCAWSLIVGLVGQTLIVGPIPRTKAETRVLTSVQALPPVPDSAPPIPFEVSNGTSFGDDSARSFTLAFLPEISGMIASLFGFAAPKSNESNNEGAGFENAVLEPLYKAVENGKLKVDSGDSSDSLVSKNSPDSTDSPNSQFSILNSPLAAPPPAGSVTFDFDGDGKADIGRWKSSTIEFKVKNSNGGSYTTTTIGTATGKIAPADYDGDNKTDVAVFDAGTWNIKRSSDGQTQTITGFGQTGDVPVSGNYTGAAAAELAVYRPSNGTWYYREVGNAPVTTYQFGASGDVAVPGNYDGIGVMDFAVFRPSTGQWHIMGSTSGYGVLNWGLAIDTPVLGDFDADGRSDPAIYRPTTGDWYVLKSSTSYSTWIQQVWGNYGDQPAAADYDGDGKTDFCVWRPTTGVWHTIKSSDGSYDYQTLGVTGDFAIPSAYTKQVGGSVAESALATARLSPKNATGGTDLYSRNFGWGTSLVGLSGRAGLDAGFGMSYNSLVWTKDAVNNAVIFDTDKSNISPGFRFGFPVIEPAYFKSKALGFAHMMVTPDGGRIEFRQTGVGNTYETADSSYAQLVTSGASSPNDPIENVTIKVTTTSGTQMSFEWKGGAFRCSKITDRNGNYITIEHDTYGLLRTVTDTLGRVITVNYDAQLYPTTITQTWKTNNGEGPNTTMHTWATFSYTTATINTNFSGVTVVGPLNGTVLKVLQKVTYADGSATAFDYNGYGQVYKVRNIAADSPSHVLNYIRTNLETISGSQSDCPRFTETRSWVENFNNGAETVVSNNILTGHQITDIDGASVTASLVQVQMQNHPTGNVTNTYVGETGWMTGLPIRTDDYAYGNGLELKRSSWTKWTQDNPALTYILNPRVIASKVGDMENNFVRRTTVDYWPDYGLTKEVKVYDTDQTTVLKKSYIEYNLDAAYTTRRIIGLPSLSESYGKNDQTGALEFVSKATFAYDDEDFEQEPNQNIEDVIGHDSDYDSHFVAGRANLTLTTRHDVTGQTANVTSRTRYDIAGSVVAKLDPLDRKVAINYTDNWNAGSLPASTFAYPTTLTDPAGNSSTVKYRYDIGANVRAQSPAPDGNTTGKITERIFDSIGRLQKDLITNTGAYTRYEYPDNGIQSKVFSTIVDTNNNNTGDTADEVMSESWADGAGRVRKSRTEHPGSIGGYSGSLVEYNILGQVKRQSVPTEINSSWNPAGDDYRGMNGSDYVWLWNSQEYDWKGRVTRSIPTDSNGTDGKDTLISYEGCGCAGGQVTTIEGELVPIPGTSNTARRKQKVYEDILGRAFKTEVLNWDGTVYSTTVETYNGHDQITNTRQSDGPSGGSVYRDVTMSYDGHGRMKTRHYPIENAGANTIWNYNADDTINTVTDPRGVVTSFAYNSRGLMTGISYDPGGSGVADTPDVGFQFDNLGNRTLMTDGTGSTSYVYDSLSHITSETKYISELNQSFTINYTYALNGAVQSFTDPQDAARKAEYSFDKLGRISEMRGIYNGTINQKLTGTQYRAWGALKKHDFVTIGSASTFGIPVQFDYDNRLQVSAHYSPYAPNPSGYVHNVEYTRNADGKVSLSEDTQVQSFTRNFEYDQVGRVTKSLSGKAVHNITGTDTPYRTTIAYNSFSEATSTTGKHWEATNPNFTPPIVATTGRATTSIYDAAGNVTQEPVPNATAPRTFGYDAAGRNTSGFDPEVRANGMDTITSNAFDGNGWRVKNQSTHSTGAVIKTFDLSSTVLGGETVGSLTINNIGSPVKRKFTPSANGVKMVYDDVGYGQNWNFEWLSPEGTTMYGGYGVEPTAEFDPRGGNVGTENPYSGGGGYGGGGYPAQNDGQYYGRCAEGGIPVSCDKQARFNQAFDSIFDRIQADRANSPGSDPSTGRHESPHKTEQEKDATPAGRQTTTTEKPEANPDKGSTVQPASVPNNSGQGGPSMDEAALDLGNVGTVQSLRAESNQVDASVGMFGDTPEVAAQIALNEASALLLAKGKCRTAIEDLLRKAALSRFNAEGGNYDKLSPEVKAEVDKSIATAFSTEAIMEALNSATPVYKAKDLNLTDGDLHGKASISRPGGVLTLTFYAGFYGHISDGKTGIRLNNEVQKPYVAGSTSLEERTFSVIHEGIHSVDSGFSDGFIGRIIKGKDKDLSKAEGSKAINEYVQKHCK